MPYFTLEQNRSAIIKLNLTSRYDYSISDKAFFHCCLHHGDDTPSLSINFRLGVYHCFACGKSGTIAELIKDQTGRSMGDFLNLRKDDLDKIVSHEGEEITIRKIVPPDKEIDIRGVVVPWNVSEEAKDYLKKRYITPFIATKMNMKYIEKAYINGTLFIKRLCIPLYNEQGQMINIEGRDVTFQQERKCLYPKGAKKSVYEWYKLDKEKPLYLFEGLIKMAVARSDTYFSNSSTVFGNMVTLRQLNILDIFKEIRIVPDNDEGGRVLVKFLLKSLKTKLKVYKIDDPSIKDADEIPDRTNKTIEQFRLDGGFRLEHTSLD